MGVTLIELEDRVRAILDEPVAAQWTQPNLRRWFNDALRDLARTTRHYKAPPISVTLTAGVAEYTLPENVLAVEHCYYDDGVQQHPLTARHYEQMDQIWGSQRDLTSGFPGWFTTWGNSPMLKLRLYPAPYQTGHLARVLAAVLPVEMPLEGSDDAYVDVPAGWVDLIVDYCEYLALRRDRDPRSTEALQMYAAKRDDLIHANDYLAVNRELVPDPRAGYVPAWHTDDDW